MGERPEDETADTDTGAPEGGQEGQAEAPADEDQADTGQDAGGTD